MAVSTPSYVDNTRLLQRLADGRLHSGIALARELSASRAGLRNAVQRLRAAGLDVQALAGRGYRLARPVELLDTGRITAALGPERCAAIRHLELLFEVDSTNSRLLACAPPPAGRADVCLCELQHAGRGRRGRRWISPFGTGIALSVAWTFSDGARSLPALSLGAGVAVSNALLRAGVSGVMLKWPNDIWLKDRKIGGVLIELRTAAAGSAHAVLGIGLNVALEAGARRLIETDGARVAAAADAADVAPSRNLVAGAILDEVLSMLEHYEREGFAALRDAWTALDALSDRSVQVMLGGSAISGTARGVDLDGALLLETETGLQKFVSGEASLRLSEGDT